ncbi:hypothetical protein WX45_03666 [Clostridium ljungdahlii DSM 13528]|uniref:Uncharacterized protein n=1 Tax=Clostridium ljungdahlii (strain ATCC 55383 / DSM 13528 / PETC) TaxID=748727 RepID=D8GPZ8_CLOLD|nr:hypothetical protein CLJU_c30410 [Clostridium ljungdahlii DSM 13528]ALU35438.1 Hypothetical protein CLAU_1009 [Clostridium autoethanogenum DSM 10061]OAA87036.1 hypothetical protein WX45_03666 [Clostridium ljungdahlii DSM 13528]OVY49707.1 hypothetical protein WX72_03408 [Clostridium autoethanogenum]
MHPWGSSYIAECNNRYIDEVSKLGVSIGFADPVSSTSLISPKQFREFSLFEFYKCYFGIS